MASKIQIVVRKTPGKVTMNKWLTRYLKSYLDELAKRYENRRKAKPEPELPLQRRGVDYFSDMEQGRATVHGYLRDIYVEENQELPEQTNREKLPKKLAGAVYRAGIRMGRKGVGSDVGHKFVFSPSSEVCAAWKAAGIDVDHALRWIVEETLTRYSRSAMGGAELGWAVGIHHDTDHYHAHVALMGYSGDGKALKLSNGLKTKMPDGSVKRIDYLSMLIGTANKVLMEYHQRLTRLEVPILKPDAVQTELQHWVQLAAWDQVLQRNLPADQAGKAALDEVVRLQNLPAEQLLEILDQSYNRRKERLQKLRKDNEDPQKQKTIFDNQAELRQDMRHLYDTRANLRQAEMELRKLRRSILRAKKLHVRTIKLMTYPRGLGVPLPFTSENRKLALVNWKSHLLFEMLDDEETPIKEPVPLSSQKQLSPGDLIALDLDAKSLRALKIELLANAAHRKLEIDRLIRQQQEQIDALQCQLAETKTNIELHQSARQLERSKRLDAYARFCQSPALLEHLGIKRDTTEGTAGGTTQQIDHDQHQIPERAKALPQIPSTGTSQAPAKSSPPTQTPANAPELPSAEVQGPAPQSPDQGGQGPQLGRR